ncbi:MAG: hypothetical protein IJ508_00640 [Oscillospiraceae bacterium]|nr:hypothetical protein [Oscillospiraceae bacterium]
MAEVKNAKKAKILSYKGRPLLRSGAQIYYGEMSDKYVALLTVLSTKEDKGLQVADKVSVQILATDPELRPRERIAKKTEKPGLYEALNIATIWLERMLAEK